MRKILLIAFAAALPVSAQAASAVDPVREIMDIAVGRWVENSPGGDYFDKPVLDKDYSKSFAATYREAGKYPAYDDNEGDPFDYDVITSSQDGCPLKDVKIEPGAEKAGVTTIDVSFRLWDCAESAEEKAKITEVKFDVMTEGGKPVINDIHRLNEGKWDSLVDEMKEIVKAGQSQQ